MKIDTSHEFEEVEEAVAAELSYLKAEGLPLEDGRIGIEALGGYDGYAYAARGGYGNIAIYVSLIETQKAIKKYKRNKNE